MTIRNYEVALRGTKKEAAAALDEIRGKMVAYGKKKSSQLLLAHDILRHICQAIIAKSTHYEIYCDIFASVLAPNVDPAANSKYWTGYLEMVRYYYYLLYERGRYTEMHAVYDFLKGKPDKLQKENDYEFIMGTYTQHLMAQKDLKNLQASAMHGISDVCTQLAELFTEMRQKHDRQNFVYKDLVKTVMRFLIPKRSQSTYKFIAASSDSSSMFNALFRLLAEYRNPPVSVEETKSLYMDYMDAFLQFFHIDETTLWSNEQIGLRFLRVYKEIAIFKSDKAMSYTLSLLYYFVKLVFAQSVVHHFVASYVELCGKFKIFFERFAEMLKSEMWFMDFVVAMSVLISKLDFSNLAAFREASANQAQIGAIELSNSHLSLILDLIRLAPGITQTKLVSWSCCTSTRKHTIFMLLRSSLKYYTFFISGAENKEPSRSDEVLFQKTFTTIMRHSVNVIDSMVCIDSSSADLRALCTDFNTLLCKITISSQVRLCVALAEIVAVIQPKFTAQMWLQLISRLRRACPISMDVKLIAEFHAIQIGCMLKLNQSHYTALMHQIGIFYTTEHLLLWDRCLLEILDTGTGPLMPILEVSEKRLLHTMEAQIIFKYQKTNILLHTSLLKCSHTDLDFILVARESNQIDASGRVQRIFKALQLKAKEVCGLSRAEKLTLAHTYTYIIGGQIEKMKMLFDFSLKDFSEDALNTLDTLLLKENIKRIDAISEMNVISMCLEALRLFEEFYKTADSEPISSDAVLLDWEVVLTDISFLARLLQLRGYLEGACQAWLLVYRTAQWLSDNNNTLRALAFLCEHVAYLENKLEIDLAAEVNKNLPIILNTLHIMQTLVPRRQNYLLLCLCQLAYYYARLGNFNYAQLLLKLAETKRDELPERRDKFDFVQASLQAVKFRILWKFADARDSRSTDSICILRQMETTFNRFRGFVQITSEDSWNYMILLFGLMQEFAECSINRLCDNILRSYYISHFKAALNIGASLRVVQCLTSWSLANLQAECVDKAVIKLKIIECFLGVKNVQELCRVKSPLRVGTAPNEHYKTANSKDGVSGLLLCVPGMETIRRVVQAQLSPVMKDKLRLTRAVDNQDLQRFLRHDAFEIIANNSLLQWTYLTIGYINARLFFLIEDFDQLEEFYKKSSQWCQSQRNDFLLLNFQNVQLLSMQHYLNYLRAHGKYDKALEYVELALHFSHRATRNVDKVYKINLELQKRSTKIQILSTQTPKPEMRNATNSLRRAIEFRLSPEGEEVEKSLNGVQKIGRPVKISPNFSSAIAIATKDSFCPCIELDTDTSSENELNTAIIGTKLCNDESLAKSTSQAKRKDNGELLGVKTLVPSCIETISKSSKGLRKKTAVSGGRKKSCSESSTPDSSCEEMKSCSASSAVQQQKSQNSRSSSRRGLSSNLGKRNGRAEVIENKENIAVNIEVNGALKSVNAIDVNAENGGLGAGGKPNKRQGKKVQSSSSNTEIVNKMASLNLSSIPLALTPTKIFKSAGSSPQMALLRRRRNQNCRGGGGGGAAAVAGGSSASGGSGSASVGEAVVATIITNTRSRTKKTETDKIPDKIPKSTNTLETKKPTRKRQQT